MMLEYAKTIIQKVSFNKPLMVKELKKAMSWLNEQEKAELTEWASVNFGRIPIESLNEKEEAMP